MYFYSPEIFLSFFYSFNVWAAPEKERGEHLVQHPGEESIANLPPFTSLFSVAFTRCATPTFNSKSSAPSTPRNLFRPVDEGEGHEFKSVLLRDTAINNPSSDILRIVEREDSFCVGSGFAFLLMDCFLAFWWKPPGEFLIVPLHKPV
ncbi:hypothetical protein CEXT_414841 [Caerostris extrusa]|uniref:Uncharacterized protein n=1 Tax=Caerostris extrusa TaxID=172846 RepID=A0AAV4RTK1_CAEEX|nr:hypothetical protein CEXT_414841 [Caerostris extrusa]